MANTNFLKIEIPIFLTKVSLPFAICQRAKRESGQNPNFDQIHAKWAPNRSCQHERGGRRPDHYRRTPVGHTHTGAHNAGAHPQRSGEIFGCFFRLTCAIQIRVLSGFGRISTFFSATLPLPARSLCGCVGHRRVVLRHTAAVRSRVVRGDKHTNAAKNYKISQFLRIYTVFFAKHENEGIEKSKK